MEEVKLSVVKLEEGRYQLDVRKGYNRSRPIIDCSDDQCNIMKNIVKIINDKPELYYVSEEIILKQLTSEVYTYYGKDISSNITELDSAISELVKIFKKFIEKENNIKASLAKEFLYHIQSNSDKFIKMILLGQFGSGKSTTIKALSDIEDSVDFPVVDTARTTIHEANYIFKDREKTDEFSFLVEFKSTKDMYIQIYECCYRAINSIFKDIEEKKEIIEMRDNAMKDFVTDPDNIFKIEYVLGKYYDINNSKRELPKNQNQVIFWDNLFNEIHEVVIGYLKENDIKVDGLLEKYLESSFLKDENIIKRVEKIVWTIIETLEKKIAEVCTIMSQNNMGIAINDNESIIGFKCNHYDVSNLNAYVTPFSSTNIKNFGSIVTPLVKSIVIEIPYNKKLSEEIKSTTICITDTVGFEHRKTDDSNSIEGSTNYLYNNFDIIGIIDSAKQSMNGTTENIIRELYNSADKSKLMLMYTFYDEFTKKDFEDEDDKQKFLIDLQKTTMRKIETSDTMGKFIDSLEESTYFLSGIMKKEIDSLEVVLKAINEKFEKLYDYKKIKIIDKSRPIIDVNYRRLSLIFNETQNKYLEQEREIYLKNYPAYKTTEALTLRLRNGQTYFSGSSRTLKPVDDFCAIIAENIERFIRNPESVNFEIKETVPNHKELVIDWFKEEISAQIKLLSKKIFVDLRTNAWNKLYLDSGSGVDYRRRIGIIRELDQILPPLVIDNSTFADQWLDELEKIFENASEKIKENSK